MIAALALAVLASTSTQGYNASIRGDEVTIRVYDLTKIYGPFKFYVSPIAAPSASLTCTTCPPGVTATHVVMPISVTQKWGPNGRYVDAVFPLSAVAGMEIFYFTAVTVVPYEERYLTSGIAPMTRTR